MAFSSGFQLNPKYRHQAVGGQPSSLLKQRTESGPQPVNYLGGQQPQYAPAPPVQTNALAAGAAASAPMWTTAFEGWQPHAQAMPQPTYTGSNALASGFRGYEGPAQVNPYLRSFLPNAQAQNMGALQNSWFGDRNPDARGGNSWEQWSTYGPGTDKSRVRSF